MLKSHFHGPLARSAACGVLLLAPMAAGLAACQGSSPLASQPFDASGGLQVTPGDGKERVDPSQPVRVSTKGKDSRITDVLVTDSLGRVIRGKLTAGGARWHSTVPLAAGAQYTVRVSTFNGSGKPGLGISEFSTAPVDNLLRITLGPEGSTFGVGQPVTAQLSHPVKDTAARAIVERGLPVTVTPGTPGRWHWVDDRTLHYRTKDYWPANALVRVDSKLNGTRIQQGLYGGSDQGISFRTGDRIEALVDAAAHTMTVRRNGEEIRTIPVTTGKPGFETRNGIKVILGKEQYVRMRSTTVGIPASSAEAYDMDVYWATRLTWSGEYVHAAPWSAASHGTANASHGCTGTSTEAAKWFFELVRPGDIVEVVNSQGDMMTPFDNGFGDWNLSWSAWNEGSALHSVGAKDYGIDEHGLPLADSARLRPLT